MSTSPLAKTTDVGEVVPLTGARRLAAELRNVPNMLSLSRVVLIYLSAILFLRGAFVIGVLLGLVAGLTDFADGYIARKYGQVSDIGAILDRMSDLVFESTWLIVATYQHDFSPVFLILYLLREFVVLSARLYCGERGVGLPSSLLGKMKSNFLSWSALVLFIGLADVVPSLHTVLVTTANAGMIVAMVLSYASGWKYLQVFVRTYGEPKRAAK